ADETLVDLLATLLAVGDGIVEAVIDFAVQEIFQCPAVALGKRRDDDLVGRLGAVHEMVRIEAAIGPEDVDQALADLAVARSIIPHALLPVGVGRLRGSGARFGLLALAPGQGDHLVLAHQLAVALLPRLLLRLVALEAGLLVPRPTSQNAAQLEEDDDCQNQEDDREYVDAAAAAHHLSFRARARS